MNRYIPAYYVYRVVMKKDKHHPMATILISAAWGLLALTIAIGCLVGWLSQ
jgi:hypothetical protein